jgi:hypothetical protein
VLGAPLQVHPKIRTRGLETGTCTATSTPPPRPAEDRQKPRQERENQPYTNHAPASSPRRGSHWQPRSQSLADRYGAHEAANPVVWSPAIRVGTTTEVRAGWVAKKAYITAVAPGAPTGGQTEYSLRSSWCWVVWANDPHHIGQVRFLQGGRLVPSDAVASAPARRPDLPLVPWFSRRRADTHGSR